jgi:cytochrome P450 family 6
LATIFHRETFGKFSLDALAACAFGVDAESFSNSDSLFVAYASRIFSNSVAEGLLGGLCLLPGISALIRLAKVNTFKPKETRFFRDVVLQSIRQRQESGERKNDLIDLMIDSMKQAKEECEEERLKIDEELVVATAMVMLIAGYESENFAKMFDIFLTKCFGGSRLFFARHSRK